MRRKEGERCDHAGGKVLRRPTRWANVYGDTRSFAFGNFCSKKTKSRRTKSENVVSLYSPRSRGKSSNLMRFSLRGARRSVHSSVVSIFRYVRSRPLLLFDEGTYWTGIVRVVPADIESNWLRCCRGNAFPPKSEERKNSSSLIRSSKDEWKNFWRRRSKSSRNSFRRRSKNERSSKFRSNEFDETSRSTRRELNGRNVSPFRWALFVDDERE